LHDASSLTQEEFLLSAKNIDPFVTRMEQILLSIFNYVVYEIYRILIACPEFLAPYFWMQPDTATTASMQESAMPVLPAL